MLKNREQSIKGRTLQQIIMPIEIKKNNLFKDYILQRQKINAKHKSLEY